MTNRERFVGVLNFQPVDRLPVTEWASWWKLTVDRWHEEGLPPELTDAAEIRDYLGVDSHRQLWIGPHAASCPMPESHGAGLIRDRGDYLALRKHGHIYPEAAFDAEMVQQWAERQATGELAVWISLDGFFWFPRTLFGIERHLYAFYDQPDLMQHVNEDLLAYNLRVVEQFGEICVPDFMTFGE